jgi:membrane protein DedA with SNARE-associated domain
VGASIWHLLHHHDLLALFGLLTVEESGVPVPVPGDIVMMYAGYEVHLGQVIWYQALLSGILATLIGSCILYNIGRRGGRPILKRYGRFLHLTLDRQDRIEGWLGRYGGAAVFAGRLVPGMRCASSFVAGTFGIPFPTFLVATAASATVWWSLFLYLGSQLGRRVAPVVAGQPYSVLFLVGGAVLMSLVPLYVRFRMSREARPSTVADAPAPSA